MDKMEHSFNVKAAWAWFLGFASAGTSWILSATSFVDWLAGPRFGDLIKNLTSLVTLFFAIGCGFYLLLINKKKKEIEELNRNTAEITEIMRETQLCDRCRMGIIPTHCTISEERRPADCPRKILSKYSGIDPDKGIPPLPKL